MRKILCLLLITVLAVSLYGCGIEVPEPAPTPEQPAIAVESPEVIEYVEPIENNSSEDVEDTLEDVENREITISFIFGNRAGLFTGLLLNGIPVGQGIFITTNNDDVTWTYTGEFDNGQFNGQGEAVWETGARRVGTYKNGSLVEGRIYADDGTLLFEGILGEQEEHTDEFIQFLLDIEFPSDNMEPISFSRDLTVHFLDVGQADSTLILLPNGENVLIDGGTTTNANSIIRYLRSHDVTTIDYLVATHPHADHIGGLPAIINEFDIGSIFMPRITHTTRTFEQLLISIQDKGLQIDEAKDGVNILSLPGLEIDIIAPARFDYSNLNDHSAVIRLVFGDTSFLFMGDVEDTSENHITADVSVDVLKVGHHGSRTSTSAAFLRKAAPSHAVISVGRNSYGHPSDDVLARLDDADVEVYRTDMVGTIVFTSDGESIIIDKSPTPFQPQAPPEDVGSGGDTSDGITENTSGSDDIVVYKTRTGQRYHNDGCRHLSRSKIETTLSAAKAQGLTACGTCRPPS
ncbi:MAG: MBL fold metallo-hydrolase [Oscillospiraceae bacterium]|nr:MBL fold metallo-hydrolase [Oscillospiraceae bacterium]